MEPHIADFLLYIHEDLSPQAQCELEDFVRMQPCVVSAGMMLSGPQLMAIAFDSDCGTARGILSRIRERVSGAEMIGL
jgi:hypothetical protein